MDSQNKYIRRMKLSFQDDRLVLRPRRLGLGVLLGFLSFVFLSLNALVPSFHFLRLKSQSLPRPALTQGQLSPLVPFGPRKKTPEAWFNQVVEAPWFSVGFAFAVFYLVSRLFRGRIVMDRRQNLLFKGHRALCRLDQITCLEVDTAPKVFVMNEVALIYAGQERMTLLLYDSPTSAAIWEFAKTIAEFLRVPIEKAGTRPA